MKPEAAIVRPADESAAKIVKLIAEGHEATRKGLEKYHAAGVLLRAEKRKHGRGTWLGWLGRNNISARHAQRCIQLSTYEVSDPKLMDRWQKILRGKRQDETTLPNTSRATHSAGAPQADDRRQQQQHTNGTPASQTAAPTSPTDAQQTEADPDTIAERDAIQGEGNGEQAEPKQKPAEPDVKPVTPAEAKAIDEALADADVHYDPFGVPIPARIKDVFAAVADQKHNVQMAEKLRDWIKGANWNKWMRDVAVTYENLNDVVAMLEGSLPYAVHSACEGNGCSDCRGCGWVTRWRHDELAEQAEKMEPAK
jgi:hypothetical protein